MPKPKKIVRGPALKWTTQWTDALGVVTKSRFLGIMVAEGPNGEIAAVAVESDRKSVKTLAGLFASHAHHIIGNKFRSITSARAAGEKYARKWLAGRAKLGDQCECDEIEEVKVRRPPPRGGRVRRQTETVMGGRGLCEAADSAIEAFELRRGNPPGIIDAEFDA